MRLLFGALLFSSAVSLFAARLYTHDIAVGGAASNGEASAAVTFFVPDRVKGFRIVDDKGVVQPLSVINREGGRIDAFFNARPGDKFVLEYHDSPLNAPAAELKSGLLHLSKPYGGATVNSLDEFRKFWKNALKVRGGWEKRIYLGGNRFGSPHNSLNTYRGVIKIAEPGTYTFHTASTDASFLLIDGKLIAQYPGRHWIGPAQTGRFKGSVELSAGNHRIEYYHANNQWSYFAIAAYSRPQDKKMTILPESMFLPLLPVTLGQLKNEDGSEAVALSWKVTGNIDIDGRQMQEVTFSNGEKEYRFEAGTFHRDGYTVYLPYAFFTPFASNEKAGEMLLGAMKQDDIEPLGDAGYRFLADAIPLFHKKELAAKFYDRILALGSRMPKDAVFKFYRSVMMDEDMAAERYGNIEKELNRMLDQTSDHARLELAKLLFYCMNRRGEAEAEFRKIQAEKLIPEFRREYRILEGDIALFSKGYDAAMTVYGKLETMSAKMSEREKVEADGNLVSLRNALITKRFGDAVDYLERVEKLRPEIRLNPEIMWLKSQFLKNLGRPRLAAHYAEAVLKMQPSPRTAAGAMLALGKYDAERGDLSKALPLLNEILESYPKSAEAIAAEKMLSDMKQKEKGK